MPADLLIHCPRLFDGRRMHADVLLHLAQGRVAAIAAGASAQATLRLPAGSLVSPGLIDLQVNGGGSVLFNDTPSVDGIARIARAHALLGTTALLPTFITDTPARRADAIAAARQALTRVPGALGIHLEGPFLRSERRGIHREDYIAQFDPAHDLAQLTALGPEGRTLITLAPETVPAGAIRALRERGAQVFAGHSAASFEQITAACAEGLDGFTHLFNAMAPLSGRAPGVIGAALLARDCYAGLILDGHHVAPGSVALLRAARGLERVVLVSDAMPPAGTQDASFVLQGKTIRVEGGRCIDDAGTLAGASITLSDAVRIAVAQYGFSPEEALACATRVPAAALGLEDRIGVLQAGAQADLVVWDAAWQPQAVLQGGHWIRALAGVAA